MTTELAAPIATPILDELGRQHDTLRRLMERCERLSVERDARRISPVELARAVARLRIALDVHNRWEELLLEPLLRARGRLTNGIAGMITDHVAEHHLVRARLNELGTVALRAAIAGLREHLELEERYLLPRR